MEPLVEVHTGGDQIVNKYTNGETQLKSTAEGVIPFKNNHGDEKPLKTEPPSTNQDACEPLPKSQSGEKAQSVNQVAGEVPVCNENENDSNSEHIEDELEREAMAELLKEAKRGAERARDMGPVGWLQSSVPKANKRFLNNTVVSTLKYLHSPQRNHSYKTEWNKHEDIYKSRSSRSGNDDKSENVSLQRNQHHKESRTSRHRESRSPSHRSSKHRHTSESHRSSDKKSDELTSKGSSKKKSHKRSHKKSKKKSKKSL